MPIVLAGKFATQVSSLTMGKSTSAEFLVVERKANSRLLLSLETSVELGVIHITNQTNVQKEPGEEVQPVRLTVSRL